MATHAKLVSSRAVCVCACCAFICLLYLIQCVPLLTHSKGENFRQWSVLCIVLKVSSTLISPIVCADLLEVANYSLGEKMSLRFNDDTYWQSRQKIFTW